MQEDARLSSRSEEMNKEALLSTRPGHWPPIYTRFCRVLPVSICFLLFYFLSHIGVNGRVWYAELPVPRLGIKGG
jgi:hypothetical protein